MLRSLLLVALLGCSGRPVVGREPPLRSQMRAAVLAVGAAVKVVDLACAARVRQTKDLELADACVEYYGQARGSLIAAETALDDGELARAGCEAMPAIGALTLMAGRVGYIKSATLEDGLEMARRIEALAPCPKDAGP